MLALGNSSDLYTFEGYDHNPFNSSNTNMDITIEFSRDFMLNIVCPSDEVMQGDINADGILNIQDIILMVNIVLGFDEYNEDADISGDGIVNILDVIQLMNSILDL
jgi:hypothetical protein